MIVRRASMPVRVGDVIVGGKAPVIVQSMTKTDTRDIVKTIQQIRTLEEHDCEIVRSAVPDREAAQALRSIKKNIGIPLVADIHFDYRLALMALEAGVDGLRLNPGNIREPEHVVKVVREARVREVPIRIGVNAGSLPKIPADAPNPPTTDVTQRMVDLAMAEIKLLESLDFNLIVVSLKSSDVLKTVEAYQVMAEKVAYPLHIGITESGPPFSGAIRSAVGLGHLLYMGIGDTLRVSLTGPPGQEVTAAYEILKALNLRQHGATLVSCPTCGRCEVDLFGLVEKVDNYLNSTKRPIKVAVMGCIVNGPGEARDADIGVACGKGKGAIFRKGEVIRTVDEADLFQALVKEIEAYNH